jgi:hypothetical protein
MNELYDAPRTLDNAPAQVKERGGVALSMWLSGVGATDCRIVAGLSRNVEQCRAALEEARALLETATGDGYVSAGWREDAERWAECWKDQFDG